MSANSPIEWTHHTFNPWWGCTKVSPGCDHCYAEAIARRFHPGTWGVDGARRVWDDLADGSRKHWNEPLGWNKKAAAAGERHRVFCASMADVFDKHPAADEERPKVWTLIHKTPALDWLLLTKRIGNVTKMVPESWMRCGFPPNVWLGISVVNQEEADRDIPKLLAVPARVRFLSCEPLLGPINLRRIMPCDDVMYVIDALTGSCGGALGNVSGPHINWVIAGGESGQKARPMHPAWARALRDQCVEVGVSAGVSFHFKQWGEWLPGENYNLSTHAQWQDGCTGQHPSCVAPRHGGEWRHFTKPGDPGAFALRVGKKAAGRLLDGRTWDEFPA